jgi:biotin transport system permease protein
MRRRRGSTAPVTSLYWPGSSWLHRLPLSIKFVALLAVSTAIVGWNHPVLSAVIAVGSVAVMRSATVPWRRIRRMTVPFIVVAAALAVVQVVIGRWREGLVAGIRLVAAAGAATAITVTTPFTAVADGVERLLGRLRVAPPRVFRVSLAVGIALRSIDHLGQVARQVLDARRARGLGRNLRAFAVPTVVAAARFAHGVGEALAARGIADPDGSGQE